MMATECFLSPTWRHGVHFPSPQIWAGFGACFDKQNATEGTLRQVLQGCAASTLALLQPRTTKRFGYPRGAKKEA